MLLHCNKNKRPLLAAVCALGAVLPGVASATLTIEPVFNRVEGNGPADTVLGFYLPELINPATGEPFLLSNRPGAKSTFPAGFPVDPVLADVVRFYNNTDYTITGFRLRIIGTAVEPEPFNFEVFPDPDVDAFFGDVDGDGLVGLSDIFPTIKVLDGGRTLQLKGGTIAPGERFTDFNLAMTSDGAPFLAAFVATFQAGDTSSLAVFGLGLLGLGLARKARRA
jgi:hypothetical protein